MLYKNWFWRWAGVLALALMLAYLAMLGTKETKSAVADSLLMAQPAVAAPPDEVFLIPLEMPAPETLRTMATAPLTPRAAERLAAEWTRKAAQPILEELIRLRAEGLNLTFEIRPEMNAVAITLLDRSPQAREIFARANFQAADAGMQACMVRYPAALTEQLLGLSHVYAAQDPTKAPATTNPSIEIYHSPYGAWAHVTGQTDAGSSVDFKLLRNGSEIYRAQTTADTFGYYYFSPFYTSCPTPGYNWMLRTGDVVQITSGATGATVSVTVVDVTLTANPQTNVVSGQTAPNQTVQVDVYRDNNDSCTSTRLSQTVTANAAGAFSATFNGSDDFNARGWVEACALDANGNGTCNSVNPFFVQVETAYGAVYGTLPPEVAYTVSLLRGGYVIAQTASVSGLDGWYSRYFTKTMQAGDVIQVDGGGVSLQRIVTNPTAALNAQTDQIEIWGGSGQLAEGNVYRRDWGDVISGCDYAYACSVFSIPVEKGGGGPPYTHPAGWDVRGGDYLDIAFYDTQGNREVLYSANAPILAANPQYATISGFWQDGSDGTLYAELYDATHTRKDRQEIYNYWSDGEFYGWFYDDILPGDQIEVGNGVVTETMTVQTLTGRMTTGSDHVTGQASNGTLWARWYDTGATVPATHAPEGGGGGVPSLLRYCLAYLVGGGKEAASTAFDIQWAGHPAGMWDNISLQAIGADGHATLLNLRAFSLAVSKDSNYFYGYTELPNVNVAINLTQSGTPYASAVTASDGGYFYAYLSDGGNPLNLTQGDVLQITANDGNSTNLTIPPFTLLLDGAQNRVYGTTLPNVYVSPGINRPDGRNSWYGWSTSTPTDANGNFSASFDGLYWWNNCAPVNAGEPCAWASGWLYTPQGHRVTQAVQQPAPAPADSFEGDDSPGVAAPYVNPQFHTFHAELEQDWISLTVSPAAFAAGTSYYIELPQMGPGLSMFVYVYDSTLINTLGVEYFREGYRNHLVLRPSAAGTYYIKAIPYSNSYTMYCGAFYTLQIRAVTDEVYLPLIQR